MRPTWRTPLLVGTLWSCSSGAAPQPRPAVVELFTSQGCSSCPPADTYLGEVAQRPDVVALAFHVDYWDDLGWRDRFGLPEAAQRQRVYTRTLHLASAFTPQVVIDGHDSYVGSDRASIARALAAPRFGTAIDLSISAGELLIGLDTQTNAALVDVLLIPYERTAISPIGRGENSGRTLKEYNIVRSLRRVGQWNGQQTKYRVPLGSLPPDATDVAVIIQSQAQAPIIGAAVLALR